MRIHFILLSSSLIFFSYLLLLFSRASEPAAGKIWNMDLSYPIGKFDFKQTVAPESRPGLIADIAAAPAHFRQAVAGAGAPGAINFHLALALDTRGREREGVQAGNRDLVGATLADAVDPVIDGVQGFTGLDACSSLESRTFGKAWHDRFLDGQLQRDRR